MANVKYEDGLYLRGQFSLKTYTGVKDKEHFIQFLKNDEKRKDFGFSVIKKNLIVLTGLRLAAQSLWAGGTGDYGIRAIAFGDGGVLAEDPLAPIAPSLGEVTLVNELFRVTIDDSNVAFTTVAPISVTFASLLTTGEHEDITSISEAGLVGNVSERADPGIDLFSRITFPSISFTGSEVTGILAEWTIFLSASSQSS